MVSYMLAKGVNTESKIKGWRLRVKIRDEGAFDQ